MCLNQKAPSKVQYKINVFKCFNSWLQIGVIPLDGIEQVGGGYCFNLKFMALKKEEEKGQGRIQRKLAAQLTPSSLKLFLPY